MQWSAGPLLALPVQRGRDGQRIRIDLDDAPQSGSRRIDRLDAGKIFPDEGMRRIAAAAHAILQRPDRDFVEFE